jgi:hypothetical protein
MLCFPAPSMGDGGSLLHAPALALVFFPPPATAGPPKPRLVIARLFPVAVGRRRCKDHLAARLRGGVPRRGEDGMIEVRVSAANGGGADGWGKASARAGGSGGEGRHRGGAGVDVHGKEITGGGRGRRGRSRTGKF